MFFFCFSCYYNRPLERPWPHQGVETENHLPNSYRKRPHSRLPGPFREKVVLVLERGASTPILYCKFQYKTRVAKPNLNKWTRQNHGGLHFFIIQIKISTKTIKKQSKFGPQAFPNACLTIDRKITSTMRQSVNFGLQIGRWEGCKRSHLSSIFRPGSTLGGQNGPKTPPKRLWDPSGPNFFMNLYLFVGNIL